MSDIPRALFEVGEEVIVCSKFFLDLNGPAIILDSKFDLWYGKIKGIPTGNSYRGWAYKTNKRGSLWLWEIALRKKHQPGDSFDTIMSDLKQPIKEKA